MAAGGREKNQREDDLGLTCKEMESLCLGPAGLPATTASLLRHLLDLRGCGVPGVGKQRLRKPSLRYKPEHASWCRVKTSGRLHKGLNYLLFFILFYFFFKEGILIRPSI